MGRCPVVFETWAGGDEDSAVGGAVNVDVRGEATPVAYAHAHAHAGGGGRGGGGSGFRLGRHVFDEPDDAVVFTFPFVRRPTASATAFASATADADGADASASATTATADGSAGGQGGDEEVAMAVCIHANAVEGYLHASRLAWPVVPPMV